MKSNERKHLLKSENSYPDIGNFVHWHIMQQQVKKKEVAASLGVIGTTVNGYFKSRSLQTGIVWKISEAIGYNLLADLGQRLGIPFETETEKALKLQIAEKDEEIKILKIQLQVYKERG